MSQELDYYRNFLNESGVPNDEIVEPTVSEYLGFIASYSSRASERRSFHDDIVDCGYLQSLVYQHHRRLVPWVQLPAYLHIVREGLYRAMGKFEQWRVRRRFSSLYSRDLGFVNLGFDGEILRFLQVKWVNEYVASPLVLGSSDEIRLTKAVRSVASQLINVTRTGEVWTAIAKCTERYARAKLHLEYGLAAQFYQTYPNITNITEAIAPIVDDQLEQSFDSLVILTVNQAIQGSSFSSPSQKKRRGDASQHHQHDAPWRAKRNPTIFELQAEARSILLKLNFTFLPPMTLDVVVAGVAKVKQQQSSFLPPFFFFFLLGFLCSSRG